MDPKLQYSNGVLGPYRKNKIKFRQLSHNIMRRNSFLGFP